MKKILFLILSLFMFSVSFSANIKFDTNTTEIILEDGDNALTTGNSNIQAFEFWTGNNEFLLKKNKNIYYTSGDNQIKIKCKNGYITKITGRYKLSSNDNGESWTGDNDFVENAILSYTTKSSPGPNDWTDISVKCKPITMPAKMWKAPDINYDTIDTNGGFETFALTKTENFDINVDDIVSKLSSSKDVDSQPSFVDVLYLQLKTIGNFSNAMIVSKNIDFKNLFQNDSDFTKYTHWVEKMDVYSSKKEFEDAFSGAITLKDVGIAQDVLLGVYDCTNHNNCIRSIHFSHSLDSKYDVYKMKEIEASLYSGTKNIIDESISYYNNVKGTCNDVSTISNGFVRAQSERLCSKLTKDNIDNIDEQESFQLGFMLGKRQSNLETIKNNIGQKGLNLKGIYNIYWELNNLGLGIQKISFVKKIKDSADITKQYENMRHLIQIDMMELGNKKLPESSIVDMFAKLKTQAVIFTPGTLLNDEVKIKYLDRDIFDFSNFSVNKGIVSIEGIDATYNTNGEEEADPGAGGDGGESDNNSFTIKVGNKNGTFSYSDKQCNKNIVDFKYEYAEYVKFNPIRQKFKSNYSHIYGIYFKENEKDTVKSLFEDAKETFVNQRKSCSRRRCYDRVKNEYTQNIKNIYDSYDHIKITFRLGVFDGRWYNASFSQGQP